MAFRVSIDRLSPVGDYERVGDFEERVVSKAILRQRVDESDWNIRPVIDDLLLEIRTDDLILGPSARPDSAFSAGVREGARVSLYNDGSLLFRGAIKDSDSPYDVNTRTQRLRIVSPSTILRDAYPEPGTLGIGQEWTSAVSTLLSSQPFAVSFDGDFSALRASRPPLNIDATTIGDAAFFSDKTIFDAVNSLLSPVLGVVVLSPSDSPSGDAEAAVARVLPRNGFSARPAIRLTDESVQNIQFTSGAARSIKSVDVSHVGGRVVRASGGLGGGQNVRFDSGWISSRQEAISVSEHVLRTGEPILQEVKLTWADSFGVPGLLDRVFLDFGDGDAVVGAQPGARISTDRVLTALNGTYRVFDVSHDLRNQLISATIKA